MESKDIMRGKVESGLDYLTFVVIVPFILRSDLTQYIMDKLICDCLFDGDNPITEALWSSDKRRDKYLEKPDPDPDPEYI